MKKICAFVLFAVLVVTSTFVYAADIDRAGFTESEVMKYVENAVVIRAGNFQCYANNYRERFDGARTDVIPFMESDSLYVPLKYMLDHYEISYVVCDDGSVSANLSGKTVVLFGSYGWGSGDWMRDWEDRVSSDGASVWNGEGIIANNAPDDDALDACKSAGRDLAGLA